MPFSNLIGCGPCIALSKHFRTVMYSTDKAIVECISYLAPPKRVFLIALMNTSIYIF